MSDRIYRGSVYHNRLEPRGHAFRYPVFFCSFDIDHLGSTKAARRLFGYNRKRLLSLRDSDFLSTPTQPLATAIRAYLKQPGIHRVTMVTVPRVFGYVFNPVTFYIAHDCDGQVVCAAAEVNNTFKERHLYILDEPQLDTSGAVTFRTAKAFHVSPFNDRKGDYSFRLRVTAEQLEVHIDIIRDGRIVFRSGIVGLSSETLSDRSILKTLIRFPFQNVLTLPRIHFHAARLYFQKKMEYFPKPAPRDVMTIKIAPPTWIERIGLRTFDRLLRSVDTGHIAVTFPDGSVQEYGAPESNPKASLRIKDYTFFRRILLDGDIGLGEAYMYGQWETADLTGLIEFLIANREAFKNGEYASSRLSRIVERLLHLRRSNTRNMSRRNIQAHYDLSNDFFKLFLDPTMLYSAAVFTAPGEDLEQAQRNKMRALIDKAQLETHHHVLEIGCGWGGLAIEIAKTVGCRVTGITISREQLAYARERVAREGLQDLVTLEFLDYRDIKGSYDRVVSVEMLEAVGHEHFGDYFAAIERVLKPDGIAVLQVITIPQQRYDSYRKSVDWIQKHIFPGGHLPSVEALTDAMTRHSRLILSKAENIGTHYATTLKHWSNRLAAQRDRLTAMGYDDIFYRTWQYYFSYCEAAFATRTLDNHHLVLKRPA